MSKEPHKWWREEAAPVQQEFGGVEELKGNVYAYVTLEQAEWHIKTTKVMSEFSNEM